MAVEKWITLSGRAAPPGRQPLPSLGEAKYPQANRGRASRKLPGRPRARILGDEWGLCSRSRPSDRAVTVPGGPPGTVRAPGAVTLGVEEEFVLLDPSTGAAVLGGPELVRMLGGEPGVRPEVMRFQVETATGVCTGLDEVGGELIRLRRLAAAAAAGLGCRLVASGVAPYRTPGLAAITGQPRYQELARRSKLRLKLRGSIGVPKRVVDTRPVLCQAVPARSLSASWRCLRSLRAVMHRSGSGRGASDVKNLAGSSCAASGSLSGCPVALSSSGEVL